MALSLSSSRAAPGASGFSLFELLLVLAIIAVMAGFATSYMPRVMSGNGVVDAARRLAGAGYEARHMAILQQRPWELTMDQDTGEYTVGPIGVLARLEAEEENPPDIISEDAPSSEEGLAMRSRRLREDMKKQSSSKTQTLRTTRAWQASDTYTKEEDVAFLTRHLLPEEVRIVQVVEGDKSIIATRISIVFSVRGGSLPTTIWLDAGEGSLEEDNQRQTVFFPGLMAPEVARGFLLPNANGDLERPTDNTLVEGEGAW